MENIYLLKEFTEFNLQRSNSDSMPMAMHVDNPQLSMDAFDKHIDNIRTANIRLNAILNMVSTQGGIYNFLKGTSSDGLDLTELKILRMYPKNEIDIDVYISFVLQEKEYYGVIEDLMSEHPKVKSEAFRDTSLYPSREWIIKISGLLIKAINKWLIVKPGKYKALKEVSCTTYDTGEYVTIDEDSEFEVIRNYNKSQILIKINDLKCVLDGKNFYFFNYWFKKLK